MNYKGLLRVIDSQETASIKEARKLLVEKAHMTEEQADKWVRNDLRGAFPILRDKRGAKFIHGVTRLFIEQQLNDAEAQNRMTRILKELNTEGNYDKFDRDMNGASLEALYDQFKEKIQSDDAAEREASKSKSYGKSDYEITGPFNTFKEAYAAWGNDSQDWCVFHMETMYDEYTKAGQVFYVAAKKGWEKIPREAGPDAPRDAYGNSLIAISVDLHGNLATATPRWNHANGGGDHTYGVKSLEEILQVSFFDTFKPRPLKRETIDMTWGDNDVVHVTIVPYQYAVYSICGVDNEYVFNKYFSLDREKRKITPMFTEPIAIRNADFNWNFLTPDGKILLDEWCNHTEDFENGFGKVRIMKGNNSAAYNYVNKEGKLISETWYHDLGKFNDGLASVYNPRKGWNFIRTDGSLLSKTWFLHADDFSNAGVAIVTTEKGENAIDRNGNFISDTWYYRVEKFHDGLARVQDHPYSRERSEHYNYMKSDGSLLLKNWVDLASRFSNGFAEVQPISGELTFFINTDGKLISNMGFNTTENFTEAGLALVGIDTKGWNLLKPDGSLVLDEWVKDRPFYSTYRNAFMVTKDNDDTVYLIGKGGKLVDSAWKQAMGLLKKLQ